MVPPASWLRRVAAAASWLAVTTVAAIGSWLGMSAVFAGQTHPARTDLLVTDVTPPPQPESDEPAPSPSDAPPVTTRESDDESPDPTTSPTTSSPSPSPSDPPTSAPIDTWYPVEGDTYEGTFGTEGGTTTVQVNPAEALVVSASPADGYSVDVERVSAEMLVIYFFGAETVVTVEVWWEDGPTAKITTMS